jgi:hypothetical protein
MEEGEESWDDKSKLLEVPTKEIELEFALHVETGSVAEGVGGELVAVGDKI